MCWIDVIHLDIQKHLVGLMAIEVDRSSFCPALAFLTPSQLSDAILSRAMVLSNFFLALAFLELCQVAYECSPCLKVDFICQ